MHLVWFEMTPNQHNNSSLSLLSPVVLQLLSDSQINMVKVVNSVSDALNAMQKENVGLKARVKADLQRAPVRGTRLKGCSNGKRSGGAARSSAHTCPIPLFQPIRSSICPRLCSFNSYSPAIWPLASALCLKVPYCAAFQIFIFHPGY